jgi:hypothetical protein
MFAAATKNSEMKGTPEDFSDKKLMRGFGKFYKKTQMPH